MLSDIGSSKGKVWDNNGCVGDNVLWVMDNGSVA